MFAMHVLPTHIIILIRLLKKKKWVETKWAMRYSGHWEWIESLLGVSDIIDILCSKEWHPIIQGDFSEPESFSCTFRSHSGVLWGQLPLDGTGVVLGHSYTPVCGCARWGSMAVKKASYKPPDRNASRSSTQERKIHIWIVPVLVRTNNPPRWKTSNVVLCQGVMG